MSPTLARVACIIPAQDEQQLIAATVTAARTLPHVELVIVCDDGSTDGTGQHAAAAGAIVVTHKRNRGKAAALESGVNALGVLEQRDGRPECGTLLFLDADLGSAAAGFRSLVEPVVAGRADLTIAVLPPPPPGSPEAGGPGSGSPESGSPGSVGLDLLVGAASRGITELTGWTPRAPLSGQRCLTRRAFELASPLAAGWGADVGMTVDVLRAGLRVEEIPVASDHHAAGHDPAGPLHRARQLRDVGRALAARGLVADGWEELRSQGVSGLLDRGRGIASGLAAKRRGRGG